MLSPTCTIVLAVADAGLRRDCLACLDEQNHRVVLAEDGKQALERFHTERPDLVLLDPELPLIDGLEVLQRLRRETAAGAGRLPVLALLKCHDSALANECLAGGADDVVEWPVDRARLQARLRLTLDLCGELQAAGRHSEQLRQSQIRIEEERDQVELLLTRLIESSNVCLSNLEFIASPKAYANGDLILSARGPDGSRYVLLGDFSGHGLTAALGVLPVTEIFHAMAAKGLGLGLMAAELNHRLCGRLPVNLYLAACLFRLDADGRRLAVINAGMPPPWLVSGAGQAVQRLASTHPPLGILNQDSFETQIQKLELDAPTLVYACSDGLLESLSWEGEALGEARIEACLQPGDGTAPDLAELYDMLLEFRQGRPQQDDTTLLRLVCGPASMAETACDPVIQAQEAPRAEEKQHQ